MIKKANTFSCVLDFINLSPNNMPFIDIIVIKQGHLFVAGKYQYPNYVQLH